jgi:DNA-binding MarR family transcriptional regulator
MSAILDDTARHPEGPGSGDCDLRAWRGMVRAHAMVAKALDAELEARHGLPLSSFEVLTHLSCADGCRMRMRELATSAVLSRSGLTRLADRLEREGLIQRVSCSSDARGAFAELTPAGAAKVQEVAPTHVALVRSLFLDRLDPCEQLQLAQLWEQIAPRPCCDDVATS